MKATQLFTIAVAATLATSTAQAHEGPRVWVAQQAGRLVTETSDDDYDPSSYWANQVFTGELSPYFGTYTTQFPGYESPRDGSGGVTNGTTIGFKIAGPLLTLNPSSTRLVATSERFSGQPTIPQLAITFPDVPPSQAAAYTRYTSTGVVPGYNFSTTIEEHAHLAYTFLGDGSSAVSGPDGVFVVPMVLTSPSLATSKWYFLTFKKGADDIDLAKAVGLAQPMASARPGDANWDGSVNFDDLVKLAQNYNTPTGAWWARGDFNFDGAVNFDDLVVLAQNYGSSSAAFSADWSLAQSMVPEPTTTWVAAGAITLILRRRRSSTVFCAGQ